MNHNCKQETYRKALKAKLAASGLDDTYNAGLQGYFLLPLNSLVKYFFQIQFSVLAQDRIFTEAEVLNKEDCPGITLVCKFSAYKLIESSVKLS